MSQIVKIRLPDGRTMVPSDWTTADPLYSTIELTSGSYTTLSAFSYGIGMDVPGSIGPRRSQITDTNLEGTGAQLPTNEELVIYSIAVEVFHIGLFGGGQGGGTDAVPPPDAPFESLNNILRLQRDLLLVTEIADIKQYTSHPVGWYPAGMGVEQYNGGARTAISSYAEGFVAGSNGGVSVDHRRLLASPLYVAGGESLRIDFVAPQGQITDLDCNATTGRVRLRTYLDGFRRRPVS